jgi:hypothetical protein
MYYHQSMHSVKVIFPLRDIEEATLVSDLPRFGQAHNKRRAGSRMTGV